MFFSLCRQYLYVDEKNKKSNRPAPDYVNFVMNDCQKSIKDESVFPTKYGKSRSAVISCSRLTLTDCSFQ